MARIDWVESRLREWGEWVRSEGRSDKGAGYPKRSVLHPDWGAPGKGSAPTFKVEQPGRGATTHFHIGALSQSLQEALLRHYAANESVASIAAELGKAPATIDQRIWRAHAVLAHVL